MTPKLPSRDRKWEEMKTLNKKVLTIALFFQYIFIFDNDWA